MREQINSYKDLRVFNEAFTLAMEIFMLTKKFPSEERDSLTDQLRRSSRFVCVNLAQAWRNRRNLKYFISKLNDCESGVCETQISMGFANEYSYITKETRLYFEKKYDNVLGMLAIMIEHPEKWIRE